MDQFHSLIWFDLWLSKRHPIQIIQLLPLVGVVLQRQLIVPFFHLAAQNTIPSGPGWVYGKSSMRGILCSHWHDRPSMTSTGPASWMLLVGSKPSLGVGCVGCVGFICQSPRLKMEQIGWSVQPKLKPKSWKSEKTASHPYCPRAPSWNKGEQ